MLLQKNTYISVSDSSKIRLLRILHIFKKKRKFDRLLSKFGKAVIIRSKSRRWRRRRVRKKNRFLIFRLNVFFKKSDGLQYKFKNTAVTCMKKRRLNFIANYLYGPCSFEFKIRRFRNFFNHVI